MPLWLAIIIAIPLGYLTIFGILTAITMALYNLKGADSLATAARHITHWWATPLHYFSYIEWFSRS